MTTIKWGIIGLGKIANKFARDLSIIEGAELFAVASRDQVKADSFAKQFNAHFAFDSYEALAKNPKIDAIYIATPHSFHKEHSILCMKHGKAVLCEKTFAMNSNDVAEMIAMAREKNVLLMEAMWTYFLPHYQYVLNELQSKRFGNITKLEADFGFKANIDMTSRVFKKSLGGGSLLDIGIYPIFAALSTLGKPIDIDAKATFFENGVDSSCDIIFNYNNGVKAFLKSSLLENTATEAVFHCEKGSIKINSRFHEPSSVTLLYDEKVKLIKFETKTLGYSYEILHFNELIRLGKTESPIMTFDFSRNLINLMDNVRNLIDLDYP